MWCVTCKELDLRPFSGLTLLLSLLKKIIRASSDPPSCSLRAGVPCVLLHILWPLFVTSGSAVIDYEIQRRAFGRHTSPLARYLTTIDFLGPCLRRRIKSGCRPLDTKPC